ncbi:MAG: hypothetical protein AB7L13_05350 [Acidimicrobiia bacterium]
MTAPTRTFAAYPTARPFTMISELSGGSATVAADYLRLGIADGVSMHAPLSAEQRTYAIESRVPVVFYNFPSDLGSCFVDSYAPDGVATMKALTAAIGEQAWMLAMPEFDQSGGCWTRLGGGRPKPAGNAATTYAKWLSFYRDKVGLGPVLDAGPARGYKIAATCAFAFCPRYAYELGNDLVLLERGNDEVSGIVGGLAMLRGASVQAGDKPWGIDISSWRYWSDAPTTFDSSGRLIAGWSTSWFERLLYIAYMSGADMTYFESADYTTGATSGELNPLGLVLQRFHDFVQRNPERGTPFVPIAFVEEHSSGFEPRYGEYNQADYSWYSELPYTAGDRAMAALLETAFPGYATHGTLVSGGPRTTDEYKQRLALGEDPRPWEPMGTSRWGESIDVISNRSTLETLLAYRAVVLTQDTPLSDEFASALKAYTDAGGTVVVRARQLRSADAAWSGVRVTSQRGIGRGATWIGDGTVVTENEYSYSRVSMVDAAALDVVAATDRGDPLVTHRATGSGHVYVLASDLAAADGTTLQTVTRLLDSLNGSFSSVSVEGPPVEYLVNTLEHGVLVSVVNTGATTWIGTIVAHDRSPQDAREVRDVSSGVAVATSAVRDGVGALVSVPPFEARVFAIE